MEDTVKERLKLFLKQSNIKGIDFCQSINVSLGFISSMRESIQPDKLKSIAIKYPLLDIGWLMTGEGSMLKSYQASTRNSSNNISHDIKGNVSQPIISHIGDGGMSNVGAILEAKKNQKSDMKISRLEEEIARLKIELEFKDKLLNERNKVIDEKERLIQIILDKNR